MRLAKTAGDQPGILLVAGLAHKMKTAGTRGTKVDIGIAKAIEATETSKAEITVETATDMDLQMEGETVASVVVTAIFQTDHQETTHPDNGTTNTINNPLHPLSP
jgi:hypothetical protein